MQNNNMDKNYNPKEIEDKIYKKWLDNNCFYSKVDKNKKPWTIIMPPPNVTGKLHMGHALDIAIQDSIIRYKRMKGYEVLWQPGTDHAAISTEVKVTNKLKQLGLDKYQIGREAFLKEAWNWKNEYEQQMINQQKKIGASCDWSKLRFTMDEGCSKAVLKAFKNMYDKGLIYKGNKIINWCPVCKTTISDAEVLYNEQQGHLYHIKYFFADDNKNFITIATTRPETMLGDTAIAVNPNEDRYKHLIGKEVVVPLVNRNIKIISDEYVDIEFGTGLVKITPCHDPNDFLVGLRHNLEQINIMNDDATINFENSKYNGLDRYVARKMIVEDLKQNGYLEKIEDHMHNVGCHDRCNTTIEPLVKSQWFVKMEELAKPAIDVLKKGELRFIPDNYKNTYLHWLENIKDWCISRQIWWGHRIPVYYCEDCGHMTVSEEKVECCEKCKSKNIYQDEGTLDTWFSSALWPFSTLGWPEKNEIYDYFYPTDVLVTGYDIIFFWVIRMVFSGIEHTGVSPFKDVLIHGIVRDEKGRKMSKSLGNGIDPLEIVDEYGADALRLALLTGNAPGNDMRFKIDKVESSRNFLNKIWNATRFILMNDEENVKVFDIDNFDFELKIEDKWVLSKMNNAIKNIDNNIEKYDIGVAIDNIIDFVWNEFCDWYIEIVKTRLYSEDKNEKNCAISILKYIIINCLKLIHPFCPFITEEIYDKLNDDLLISSSFPEYNQKLNFEDENKNFEYIKNVIKNIRNKRQELNVPNNKKINIIVIVNDKKIETIYKNSEQYIYSLSNVNQMTIYNDENEDIKNNKNKFISLVFDGSKIYIPFEEMIDIEKEKNRLAEEIKKCQFEYERASNMLSNEKFVSKAPQNKIEEEKQKLVKYKSMIEELSRQLKSL